jgi:protein-S-isoprenylcysteine O-methyltransferase Ste14
MLWLVLGIALWGAVHSWMASLGFKETVRRRLGEGAARSYRLVYNAFSVVTFGPILLLVKVLPDRPLYAVPAPWLFFMVAGQLAAIVCIIIAVLQVDAAAFIGLRQVIQGEEAPHLVTNGFYRWIRHPLYLFGLLILWLTPVMTRNLLVAYLALSAYLVLGALFEERKLLREYGAAYAEYRARTPMLIPLLKQAGKTTR